MSESTAPAAAGDTVPLPAIEISGDMPVERAIQQRRSVREFARDSVSLTEVSQLLWAAQGITGRGGLRAAPSAGALYPIELYLLAGNVAGLDRGVYRYRPKPHHLVLVAKGDQRASLAAAALGQKWVRDAPATLVITADYDRSTGKYGRRGHRYTHIEVGHVAQNVYLQATARGLATVFVGAFRDAEVQEALGLPSQHEPLGLLPFGRPR